MKLSDACKKALKFLSERTERVVFDRHGRGVCGGELMSNDPITFVRLVTAGALEADGQGGLVITPTGREALKEKS